LIKVEKIKIIIVIVCISFTQVLQYSVAPVLGQVQNHFSDVKTTLIQMLITAPSFVAMVFAVLSGFLVVKISKKKLLVFGCFMAGITGFIPLLSDSFNLLFLSKILYGIGMGLASTLNAGVVAEYFEGEERTYVMGIQSASVGAGMVVVTTCSGYLGGFGFQTTYYIHIIGFISMILIFLLLPETGKVKAISAISKEKIRINKDVLKISFWGFLEFLFLISFTTNIAMHISGSLAGNSGVSGILTGIFSGSQIFIGLILGFVTRIFRKYTLPVAMLLFSIGTVILICFSYNFILIALGAALCGFSQGIFMPRALVDVSNAVKPVSTAMAAACLICFTCLGQFISPIVLNTLAHVLFGSVTTTHVYLISAAGMALSAGLFITTKLRRNT
jgi:MFS family permease